ncbi:efflux RND transporter periplasmic adaptor subunit [Aminobacter sp. AP02]|uniref:efflux RND transporter periplasmic adaptor subunit n=1 Tax=Aminobacter sp. AP02 TaxID=2135737 RepID=UPI000D6CDA0F|nr:efflux RND transporter periplasmic adaptor subunit [Aminobacter sp. AP02]PWK73865.1 membrane fusion protein (multidrug efflux system) [Aminobacter sp. AP02]
MRRYFRRSVALTLLLAVQAAAGLEAQSQEANNPAGAPLPVTVTKVVSKDLRPTISFTGRVEAIDKVGLRARVDGFLEKKLFTEGQQVKVGDLLFVLEKGQYEAAVSQAQGALESGQAALALANIEVERQSILVAKNTASKAALDLANAKQQEATGSVVQCQASLDKAKLDLGYTEIRAPITGRVGRSQYSVGTFVGPSSDALAIIVSQDPIYVTFSVSQRELLAVREKLGNAGQLGAEVEEAIIRVQLADGSTYAHSGKVNFVDVTVDQGTDTVPVRATFPNPELILIDGQLVNVTVEGGTPEARLVVPQSAIQLDQSGAFALVVNKDHKIEVRRIQADQTAGSDLSVTSGLNVGDMVVTEGIQRVRPGQVVEPVEAKSGS